MDKLQKDFIDVIINTANIPSAPYKIENLNKILVKYYLYCQKKNLNTFDGELKKALENVFIVDNEEKIFDVDSDIIGDIVSNLESINLKNNSFLTDGLEESDAKTLLDWVVLKTRNNLINQGVSLRSYNIKNFSQITSSIIYNILIDLGLDVIFNDDTIFPNGYYQTHTFVTVKLPIKKDKEVKLVPFLLDCTYRSFFSLADCHEGLATISKKMAAGYYVSKLDKGLTFAREIIENGYVELTSDVAKIYGLGFSLSSHYQIEDTFNNCLNVNGETFLNAILNQNKDVAFSKKALESLGYTLDLPIEYLL